MKLGFSQQEIITTAKSLGLPTDGFIQRRVARAFDLVESNKVSQIDDGIFRVRSQYEPNKSYIVNVNHGQPFCDCPDGERTQNCKHRIASLLFSKSFVASQVERAVALPRLKEAKPDLTCSDVPSRLLKVTWDDTENSYHKRGRWWVTDYKRRIKYIIYRDGDGNLICPCGRKPDCEHRKAIREYLSGRRRVNEEGLREGFSGKPVKPLRSRKPSSSHANNGEGRERCTGRRRRRTDASHPAFKGNLASRIVNECGSAEAQAIQYKLNGQSDSQGNKWRERLHYRVYGNGAEKAPFQLNVNNPFEESESYDIDQIEGRRNGELAWKLRNGEYVVSYRGIMTLAEKHDIKYDVSLHDDTHTVIAKAMNGNERISGKELKISGSIETASELAKRNAARQLLPLPEIKAVEHKAKLEAEFNWQVAKAKCENTNDEASYG